MAKTTRVGAIFTKASGGATPAFQTAENEWTVLRLRLETSGIVVYGTISAILPPALTGALFPIPPPGGGDNTVELVLAPKTLLWIQSQTVNRISIVAEPHPVIEMGMQIIQLLKQIVANTAAITAPRLEQNL